MGELIGNAWIKAATPQNVISGFKVTGIWPFDRNVFGENSFLPASITDRPLSESLSEEPELHLEEGNSPETLNHSIQEATTSTSFQSPEMIRGFPKVGEN